MAQGKVIKFTVSAKDQVVHEWIALQSKASFSITMAIQEYIANHGMRDMLNVNKPTVEQQALFNEFYGNQSHQVPAQSLRPVVQSVESQHAIECPVTPQATLQQVLNQVKVVSQPVPKMQEMVFESKTIADAPDESKTMIDESNEFEIVGNNLYETETIVDESNESEIAADESDESETVMDINKFSSEEDAAAVEKRNNMIESLL